MPEKNRNRESEWAAVRCENCQEMGGWEGPHGVAVRNQTKSGNGLRGGAAERCRKPPEENRKGGWKSNSHPLVLPLVLKAPVAAASPGAPSITAHSPQAKHLFI